MPNTADSCRLFFALWPEERLRKSIQQCTAKPLKAYHGRPIIQPNWHITLAFIGQSDKDKQVCLLQAASRVHAKAFSLRLDHLGYWPRARIIWLAPTDIPDALNQLQADLNRALTLNCGYQAEKRLYRPHLSLMRKAQHGPELVGIPPLDWHVNRFALVSSQTRVEGVVYEVLKFWSLDD